METEIGHLLTILLFFGGIVGIIGASGWAKAERIRAERQSWQSPSAAQNEPLLEELKALKQQVMEMQSTSHQFDLSFDAALDRLESRVSRLETKPAASTVTASATGTSQELRNGITP